jgi:hypothetical protein
LEYLQSTKATDEGKLKIAQVLHRAKEEEQRDAEEFSVLKRLEELDLGTAFYLPVFDFLDDPDLFSKLTKEEQLTFLSMVEEGNIAKLVPIWKPWWLNKDKDFEKVQNYLTTELIPCRK